MVRVGATSVIGAAVLVAALVVAAWGPLAVVLGANRLLVLVTLGCGAWLSVRRVGVVDLSTGAVAAVGAYAGGVVPALAGWPAATGLLTGTAAGAVAGGLAGAVAGRVGRVGSAVTSLAAGVALTGALVAVPTAGGAAGFHAVPLLTGTDRGDAVVLAVLVLGAVVGVAWLDRRPVVAAAAVALRAPAVLAAGGRRPTTAGGSAGIWSGALLGVGGAVLATTAGSVAPATFGLTLSAGLLLAAAIGGGHPVGAIVGVLVVYGPSIVWPTVPLLGDAPLLVLGPLGLVLLAVRPAGIVHAAPRPVPWEGVDGVPPAPLQSPRPLGLDGTPTVPGRPITLTVEPGEVVAVVGRNGSGKSTLLARIGGQLDDGGTVRLGEAPPPAGSWRRARGGIVRTFQHAPDADVGDVLTVAGADGDLSAAAWAAGVLGAAATSRAAGAALVALAAARPRVALLDEPAALLDPAAVAAFARGLAAGGCVVVVVEHRAELVATADRTVRIGEGPT